MNNSLKYQNFHFSVDFNPFKTPSPSGDMKLLEHLVEAENGELLYHPVTRLYIQLKWRKIHI